MSENAKIDNNTGDFVYQINNISEKILKIQKHLTVFKKDFKTKLILYKLVARRKRQLKYLEKNNFKKYQEFIKNTKIRIAGKSNIK